MNAPNPRKRRRLDDFKRRLAEPDPGAVRHGVLGDDPPVIYINPDHPIIDVENPVYRLHDFFDDFNRADAALGSNWVLDSTSGLASIAVVTNAAQSDGGGTIVAALYTGWTNYHGLRVSMKILSGFGSGIYGHFLTARGLHANNPGASGYQAWIQPLVVGVSATLSVKKNAVILASATIAMPAAGDTLTFDLNGSTLTASMNGTDVTATDAAFTGGYVGFGGNNNSAWRYDDFRIIDRG